MKYITTAAFVLITLIGSVESDGATRCSSSCGGSNAHNFTTGASAPFLEDITTSTSTPYNSPMTINGPTTAWTVLQAGCSDVGQQNLRSSGSFHALLRAYVRVDGATAAPGAKYEVQLLVDGVERGHYVRALRGLYPQGDHFNGTVQNVSSGNHAYAIRARLLDSGSVTFGQQFITAQGIPASYPSAKFVDANTTTLTGTWQKITSDVPFSAATDVDVYLQGYFQLNSGTPGQKISVGFSLDDASSTRTSDLAVPPYFRDGVNIFDHLIRVPAGTHTLSLWAVNRDGGSTQIQYRQLEFVAFPSSTPIVDGIATSTQLVDSQNTETQPTGILLNAACGKWTKLLEYQLSPLTGDFNWTGEGFVELLGRQSGGDWASARGEIAVQVLTGTGAEVDIHFVQFSIPAGRGQLYFFQDAMIWGNQDGNTVRLWIRKEVGCGGGHGSFNVGKRYLSTKLVADNSSCYYN